MKRFMFYLGTILLGIILVGFSSNAQEKVQTKKHAKVQKQIHKQKTVYVCPMDTDVQSDKPGKCPKCKMNLEKKVIKIDEQPKHLKEAYACPMHPEEKSDKPGKCSKCGMNLEKVKK